VRLARHWHKPRPAAEEAIQARVLFREPTSAAAVRFRPPVTALRSCGAVPANGDGALRSGGAVPANGNGALRVAVRLRQKCVTRGLPRGNGVGESTAAKSGVDGSVAAKTRGGGGGGRSCGGWTGSSCGRNGGSGSRRAATRARQRRVKKCNDANSSSSRRVGQNNKKTEAHRFLPGTVPEVQLQL